MLNIPDEVKALFKNGSAFKNFHVHFPNGENADLNNDDIVAESVQFTESICSKEVFQFGLSERSQIEFECVGVQNIFGMTIECAIEICLELLEDEAQFIADHPNTGNEAFLDPQICTYNGRNMYRVPYGRFIIESCPRSQGAMKHRKVNAYSGRKTVESSFTAFKQNYAAISLQSVTINPFAFTAGELNDLYGLTYTETTASTSAAISSTQFIAGGEFDIYSYLIIEPTNLRNAFPALSAPLVDGLIRMQCDYDDTVVTDILDAVSEVGFTGAATFGTQLYWAVSKFCPRAFDNRIINADGKFVMSAYRLPNPNDSGLHYSGETMIYDIYCPISVDSIKIIGQRSDGTQVVLKTLGSYTMTTTRTFTKYTLTGEYAGKTITLNSTSNPRSGYYGYLGAYEAVDIVTGALELSAMFGLYGRNGNIYASPLPTTPIQVTPAEYSELWWDEYDISSIGSIQFKTGDEEFTYMFADGSSVYDMRENYVIQNSGLTSDVICALLDSSFIPKITGFGFTPVTLDALGLPYLESGDYLEIDDADGGTVGTYILSRTLSGIQTLTDSIESKGGEVLGDGS